MHRPAHRLVASETERQVGEPARTMDVRQLRLDLGHGLDEIETIAVMLFDPGRHGEDVGVEDDVLGRKTDPGEQGIGPRADFDLARLGVGLPFSSKAMTTTAAP